MKRLFFAVILSFVLVLLVRPIVSDAQTLQPLQPTSPRNLPMNTNPDVEQNFHNYTQNVFIEMLSSAVCFTAGIDILTADGKCLGVDPLTKKIGYANGNEGIGLLPMMGNLIGATYNLPASTGTYMHYLAGNFGITRNSFAKEIFDGDGNDGTTPKPKEESGFGKGIGFDGLTPVLGIWKAFRNLTYLVFVLIFVVLGLGIMFRVNIDARAVMSIQNQLPKIIMALIFITFSYAIAGFLIDMMYLSIYLIVHVFDSQKLATVSDMSNPFNAVGGLGGLSKIASPVSESVVKVFTSIFDGALGSNVAKIVTHIATAFIGGKAGGGIGALAGFVIGGVIGSVAPGPGTLAGASLGLAAGKMVGTIIGGAVGASRGPQILTFVAGIIIYLVIIIALLRALFTTWISLIKAYVFILLDVIFAPIFIMGGLVPGSTTGGFTSWIRSLLGNLAAFPTVLILFMIGASVQSQLSNTEGAGNFIPPLVGISPDGSGELIAGIIGLGIILIMPEAVNLSKGFFKAPERKLAQAALAPVGVAMQSASKPFKNAIGSVWGEDKHTGAPKWLTKKVRSGGTFLGAVLTGGTSMGPSSHVPGAPKAPLINMPKGLSNSWNNAKARGWKGWRGGGGGGGGTPPATP